jgi:tetratricopeptide (TPR) repeat protein
LKYLDFDLEIGLGSGRKYPISVVHSPAGEAREIMRFPFSELMLENRLQALQITLLRSGGNRRHVLSLEEQAVQDFGRDLFAALFTGEVRSRYDVSQREAAGQDAGLRLKLRVQSPVLAVLPWEFLYDPRQAEYVCLSHHTPMIRYLELPQVIQPLTVTPPLRILGMVASPRDLAPLDVEREKQRMGKAIKDLYARDQVDLTWLEGQTWRDLQRVMRGGPWHVFHFIGHGGFDKTADEGLIALADEDGYTYRLHATELGRLLADHRSLRLVLLNSCEGARGSERDIFSSTATILMRRGIPAVLAMQYEITDQAAIEFARSFYEALADGLPVDAAVTEARKAISLAVANTVEWGTPVLYMRSPEGVLFQVARPSPKEPPATLEPIAAERLRQEELAAQHRREEAAREQQARWAEQFRRVQAAIGAGHWSDALHLLNQLRAEAPEYEREATESLLTQVQEAIQREQRLRELYQQAETHLRRAEWSPAVEVFQQVLAINPNYRDTARHLERAQNQVRYMELYAQGMEQCKARRWKEALATFQALQRLAGKYKDLKKQMAATQREIAREEAAPIPSVRQRAASLWSSVRPWVGNLWLWAGIFLLAVLGLFFVRANGPPVTFPTPTPTPTQVLTATPVPIVVPTSEPTSTPVPTPTATPTPASIPTSTPASIPTSTPASIPTSTSTSTHTPVSTPTPTPSFTPSTPSPTLSPTETPQPTPVPATPTLLPAPRLIEPANAGRAYPGKSALRWAPVGELGPDGYYVVEITFPHEEATWYDGGWVKESTWAVPNYFGWPHSSTGRYEWSVTVMQWTGNDAAGKPIGQPISPKSPTWSFYCPGSYPPPNMPSPP